MSDPKYTNQLIHEKSPYLLQHAHNPVNWYPWGDEAFTLAKKDNKPVLVSIGYATCHWCHVMERESFEDPKLAEFLNTNFYAIKVDREERPDVDSIYMKAIQALSQQGGWPLNIFVTPDGVPFYGGTYFPPMKKFNLPSFSDVLHFLDNTWKNDQEKIAKQTDGLITYLKNSAMQEPSGELDSLGFQGEDKARKLYGDQYDTLHHGFRFQPQNKFPPSMGLSLLLRNHH
ncbi:MAG: thioredoxin domain-containing protein, partial [Nitrospinota bacterium]|nr:thioredoxin domain-containing protein [Nitrospinota bacterium]